jgi:hypothetical protein
MEIPELREILWKFHCFSLQLPAGSIGVAGGSCAISSEPAYSDMEQIRRESLLFLRFSENSTFKG